MADFHFCDCQPGADANCVPGNDANDGSTPALAKQTVAAAVAIYNTMSNTDRILYSQGGSFTSLVGSTLANPNGTPLNPLIMTDYDPTGAWTPAIPGVKPLVIWANDTHGFQFQSGGGYLLERFKMRMGLSHPLSITRNGLNFLSGASNITIDNMEVDNFTFNLRGITWTGENGHASNVTVKNSNIINAYSTGWFGNVENGLLDNNTFDGNGYRGTGLDHNIYISSGNQTGNNHFTVSRNTLTRAAPAGDGFARGISLVSHGVVNQVVIDDNDISEVEGDAALAAYGIEFGQGYSGTPEVFDDIAITNNRISRMGEVYINLNGVTNSVIENNILEESQVSKRTRFIRLGAAEGEDAVNANVAIRNNDAYIRDASPDDALTGIQVTVGTGIAITNNAIHYTGSNANIKMLDTGSLSTTDNTNFDEIDNNIFYHPNAPTASWIGAQSLAQWQAASIFDATSQDADPGFKDPANQDFSALSASSNMVEAGNATYYSPTDITGAARTIPVDVGAYEFGGLAGQATITNPQMLNLTTSGGDPLFETDTVAGIGYMVIVAQGSQPPSGSQIVLGNDSTDSPAIFADNIAVTGVSVALATITALTPAPYTAYYVQDTA